MATDITRDRRIASRTEFAGILRDDELFADYESDDAANRLNSWFDRLMIQSGLELAPSMLLLLSLCSGVTLGGILFVLQENFLSTAAAVMIGSMLPLFFAMLARGRRQDQITNQMPAMIDELARAAKTGRSPEQCVQLVAYDTPKPLGIELQICARRLQMGVGMHEALRNLPERTGLVSLNFLVMALTVHQQTGGDLVKVLERLSRTIRDRLLFLGRLRAATIASRATAILMIALPPAILAFFILRDPDYLTDLMASGWGKFATLLAIGLEIVGSVWVLRILKTSQRA